MIRGWAGLMFNKRRRSPVERLGNAYEGKLFNIEDGLSKIASQCTTIVGLIPR